MQNPNSQNSQASLIATLRRQSDLTNTLSQIYGALETGEVLPIEPENLREAFAGLNSKKFLLAEDIQFFLASATLLSRWTKDEKAIAKFHGTPRPIEDIYRREISHVVEQLAMERQKRPYKFQGLEMRIEPEVVLFQLPNLQFSYHSIGYKDVSKSFMASPMNGQFEYWNKKLQPAASLVFEYAREARLQAHTTFWLRKMLNS